MRNRAKLVLMGLCISLGTLAGLFAFCALWRLIFAAFDGRWQRVIESIQYGGAALIILCPAFLAVWLLSRK